MDTSMFNALRHELAPSAHYENEHAVSDYLLLRKILKVKKRLIEEQYKKHRNAFMADVMYHRFEEEANGYTTKQLRDLWEVLTDG